MNYARYVVVLAEHRALAEKLVGVARLFDDEEGRFTMLLTDDAKLIAKLPRALAFHNDEYAAWGFTLTERGKTIAHALFGENSESGVSLEDNALEGDLDAIAMMFGVDPKRLKKRLAGENPDVEKFADFLGFGLYPVTPYDVKDARAPKKEPPKKKPAKKKATTRKRTGKSKTSRP